MGAMKTLYFDIKEASEKIIKELDTRPLSSFFGDFQAVNTYKYLFLEGLGAELIRASAKYKKMVEPEEEQV